MDKIGPLFEEKQNYLEKINSYFCNNRMGYIKVPTGWGKTFLAKHLMKQYVENKKRVLFLVSRNNQLLTQTFYGDDGYPLFPESVVLSSEHDKVGIDKLQNLIKRGAGGIIFASLQTIISKNNGEIKDILSQNSDLLIIDELHNFIDNRGNTFITEFDNRNTKIFGMTATPFQGVVGNVKFVEDISIDMQEIFSKTLPQCIMEGQLCELNYRIIRSDEDILNLFDFKEGLSTLDKEDLFLDCSTLDNIQLVAQRTYLAKRIYDDKIENKQRKTLIFCAPVRNIIHSFGENEKKINAFHAKLSAAIFNNELKEGKFDPTISFSNYTSDGQFKEAVYLSSDLPKKEPDKILQAFKIIGQPPFVLCTVGMLIEGFDFPELENLILLRPTLSMRLFEQQVGRITRKSPNKTRGNIFEIVDNIDSLYDKFGENVFEEKKLQRLQMLQPEYRIEELFTEDFTTEAIHTGKIDISEISFIRGIVNEFHENSVQIPPLSLRAKYFCKGLAILEQKTVGSRKGELRHPYLNLMRMAIQFKVHNNDEASEISKLIELLDKLEQESQDDPRLSNNCKKNKPKVFNEVKWLLKLTALTSLKYTNIDLEEKNNILNTLLGFEGDYNEIDNYRVECLKNGGGRVSISQLSKGLRNMNELVRLFREAKDWFRIDVYWASCFIEDDSELKELFQSREWNYKVREFIIKQR
ncbi:MAG: DEAD/DEAH box helicase [bacterium]